MAQQRVVEQASVLEEPGRAGADGATIAPAYIPQSAPHRTPSSQQPGRREGETDFVMADRPFSVRGRLRSFKYAFRGIAIIVGSQHNAWLHLLATAGVIATGMLFGVSGAEWCWLILAIMAVWTAEALNTAFELLCDVASPEFHPLVRNAKDASAGAVLISAVGSAIIGICIFAPHAMEFFGLG